MRPRINQNTQSNAGRYGSEIYTIKGVDNVYFYRRVEAIKETRAKAIKKGIQITMLLNGIKFCVFEPNGMYRYCYDSSKDRLIHPDLRQLFRNKGIAIN